MRRPHRAPILGLLIAVGLTVAACVDDDSGGANDAGVPPPSGAVDTPPADTSPADTSPADTSPADTTPADTDGSATTEPTIPDDTEPARTDAATTEPPPTAGWTATDFVPGAFEVGYSGNWEGGDGPSPAAPTDGEPPADGYYIATVREPWDPERPDQLPVRIQRLELCSVLPDGCQYMEPNEMNVDPSWQLDLDLPLDATTEVVVFGFSCWDVDERKQATGVELVDLFSAYTADYESAIEPQLTGTTADHDVALAVAAAPTGGFVGEETVCPDGMAGPLRYVHDDAPVLLLQTVSGPRGPLAATDLVRLAGVRYTDGTPLFYFYAGFSS
jgi:hypothetical protein